MRPARDRKLAKTCFSDDGGPEGERVALRMGSTGRTVDCGRRSLMEDGGDALSVAAAGTRRALAADAVVALCGPSKTPLSFGTLESADVAAVTSTCTSTSSPRGSRIVRVVTACGTWRSRTNTPQDATIKRATTHRTLIAMHPLLRALCCVGDGPSVGIVDGIADGMNRPPPPSVCPRRCLPFPLTGGKCLGH